MGLAGLRLDGPALKGPVDTCPLTAAWLLSRAALAGAYVAALLDPRKVAACLDPRVVEVVLAELTHVGQKPD